MPAAPLEEVVKAIQSAGTLRLKGTATRESRVDEVTKFHEKVVVDFEMLLDRNGRYLIAWRESCLDGEQAERAIWNAGEGPIMYEGGGNSWVRIQDDETALIRGAAGLGNTSFAIMQTFRSTDPAHTPLYPLPLSELEEIGTDDIDGTLCRQFSYTYSDGAELVLWVERDQPLIRASQVDARDLTPAVPPEMRETLTQQELDSMPRTVSFEIREKFTRVELGEELPVSAFQFDLPDGSTDRTGDPALLPSLESLLPGLGSRVNE